MNWNNYLIKTKASDPRPLLVEALNYVKNFNKALDLGCGAMNDTKTIFKAGFGSVDAVDNNPSVSEIAKDIIDTGFNLNFFEETFSNFSFVKNDYDLISAQYSLPFTKQNDFTKVWINISNSLRNDGIFTGQFFGQEDEWSTRSDMTFLTESQVLSLFNSEEWKIIKFKEFKGNGMTARGVLKKWHVFHVIASKHTKNN
jgi:tellurite methyltransferase